MQSKLILFSVLLAVSPISSVAPETVPPPTVGATGCMVLDSPLRGGGESFIIRKPGRYCLGKNMSTRRDLPDHREQSFLISIRADNVDLDLGNYTLDRGRNRTTPGGRGIEITEKAGSHIGDRGVKNITIRNGTLRGFGAGIAGLVDCHQTDCDSTKISFDATSSTYYYAPDNISIKDVKFENVLNRIYFSDGRGRSIAIEGDRR